MAWRRPGWIIVNWTLRNKLQWNLTRNSNIFIQENAFESVVCEMASICLGLNVLAKAAHSHNSLTACVCVFNGLWLSPDGPVYERILLQLTSLQCNTAWRPLWCQQMQVCAMVPDSLVRSCRSLLTNKRPVRWCGHDLMNHGILASMSLLVIN